MSRVGWANLVFLNLLWPVHIFSAAAGMAWPGPLLVLCYGIWQLHARNRAPGDRRIVLVALLVGLLLDSLWVQTGLFRFAADWPGHGFAPLWIISLWAGMALCFNHSLSIVRRHLFLAGGFAMIFSPVSYYLASRIGAVTWIGDTLNVVVATGLSWALVFPALAHLARPKWLGPEGKPVPELQEQQQVK